jgi:hypothetical protein
LAVAGTGRSGTAARARQRPRRECRRHHRADPKWDKSIWTAVAVRLRCRWGDKKFAQPGGRPVVCRICRRAGLVSLGRVRAEGRKPTVRLAVYIRLIRWAGQPGGRASQVGGPARCTGRARWWGKPGGAGPARWGGASQVGLALSSPGKRAHSATSAGLVAVKECRALAVAVKDNGHPQPPGTSRPRTELLP